MARGAQPDAFDVPQGHRVMPLSGARHFDWLPHTGTVPDGQPRPGGFHREAQRLKQT